LLAVVGLSVGLATSSAPVRIVVPNPGPLPVSPSPVRPKPAFPGPVGVVAAGIVTQVAFGSFTMTDLGGGRSITVEETSSTVYRAAGSAATSSSVVQGALVAVEGTRNGTTVTATRVIVLRSTAPGGP
jgi:hypothetical protein